MDVFSRYLNLYMVFLFSWQVLLWLLWYLPDTWFGKFCWNLLPLMKSFKISTRGNAWSFPISSSLITFLCLFQPSVRKTHCSGRKHKENVKDYYQKWMEEQAQSLIDKTSKTFGLSCAIRTISFHLLFILSYLLKKTITFLDLLLLDLRE